MAVYLHPTHHRRDIALAAVLALVVGLLGGYLVGRSTTASGSELVARARDRATDTVTALDRLTIEYAQIGAGESTDTLTEALDAAAERLDGAVSAAPWLDAATVEPVRAALEQIRGDIRRRVSASTFAADLRAASDAVARLFGLRGTGGP
jgi:hypothetical protein